MFEFSATSIIIIIICSVGIVLLLFLYAYVNRKDNEQKEEINYETMQDETDEEYSQIIPDEEPPIISADTTQEKEDIPIDPEIEATLQKLSDALQMYDEQEKEDFELPPDF